MRIIQITDLHLGQAEAKPYGIAVRQNLQRMLAAVTEAQPDLLLITGDLCLDAGERTIYQFLKKELAATQLPYALLPGNHDDRKLLLEVFELDPGPDGKHLYYELADTPLPVYCLDTTDHTISGSQLEWLAAKLAELDEQPVVVFIHHPPLLMGVPFMDKQHLLRNHEELSAALRKHAGPCYVFCGHYHVDKSRHLDNLHVFVTPSCYFQIDWRTPGFAVAHRRIAYRDIQLSPKGIQQGLVWVE